MPRVWQLACIHLNTTTLVTGVLLEGEPFTFPRPVSRLQNLWKLVQSFFIPAYRRGKFTLHWAGGEQEGTTDYKGGFRMELPEEVVGPFTLSTPQEGALEVLQEYPTQFDMSPNAVDVITDMDDTVLVSHTASLLKRVGTMALVSPHRRKAIAFTQAVLSQYTQQGSRVIYLSKSESNLFGMLSTFIKTQELPEGPMLLTPYLKLRQLLRPKKGKNYKFDNIDFLLRHSGAKRYVLLGDDSQRDMEIYTEVAQKYPERIEKIFIRQTRSRRSQRQLRMWAALEAVGVPVQYFGPKETSPEKS